MRQSGLTKFQLLVHSHPLVPKVRRLIASFRAIASRPRPALALLAFVVALAASAPPCADAQSIPQPSPAVLTDIAAADKGADESDITLTFAPQAPGFSIIEGDGAHPSIAFALSSRGSSARIQAGQKGVFRGVDFEQSGTVMVLHLTASAKAHMTAMTVGDKVVRLVLTGAAPPEATASAAAALPHSQDTAPEDDGFEVVPLKYADVSEVVGLLTAGLSIKSNDTFVPQEPNFGSVGATGGSFAPPPAAIAEAATDALAQSVDDSIGVDRRLNAIILKGPPERIARLKAKIEAIDVPVRSVLLETVFVELDESGARNVGLNFNNASNQVAVATFQTGQFVPSGLPTSALTSVSLQAAIYAQVQAGHGKIVSRPRIAAQSGSTAKIVTGDALPILTSIALSGVNAVSQQVQYVNVGVTLQIAPRVSGDGFVTSHVFCVVSSVTGSSQGYPTISQREAETSATVHDGETFVIGGLTEESDLKSDTRLPIVGDLPGALGGLFHFNADTRSKTELYIVVTPHVIRRGDPVPAPVLDNAPVSSPPR
jgi:general secretion pathway protein D